MRFQFWSMTEDFIEGFFCSSIISCFWNRDVAVLVNTTYLIGCCDLMLIKSWIKVMYCLLLWLTLHQSGDHYLPSIHSWDSSPSQVLYIPLFFFNCSSCSACILQMRNKPNQFLIQIKVYFFPNLWFCPSLFCPSSHYYYCYNHYFVITYY